ncbi:Rieske (2Fe-2S) protein [Cupriavidus metallidurans]|uniref:Rieske (2Fe-2S) protein n=1 Tax=Cupriavidus metallidurans TaxID=119219 RepID=UPI001CCCD8E0|nr:Rieske (2Fe-2S) protein [Cupriavidus metallidurans]UBM09365.1 Rieske (2Fe-2S) protein [Cupriavidus metallidurans]
MQTQTILARIDSLNCPGSCGVDPLDEGRDTVVIVRTVHGVKAWRDACPHYGDTPMAWRKDAYLNKDGTRIVCHAHGAQFDLETGECVIGPCLGQALTPVPIVVSDEGDIFLLSPSGPPHDD